MERVTLAAIDDFITYSFLAHGACKIASCLVDAFLKDVRKKIYEETDENEKIKIFIKHCQKTFVFFVSLENNCSSERLSNVIVIKSIYGIKLDD